MFDECIPIKSRRDGTYIFFPNGTFSKKGYILNQNEANRIRNFIVAYYYIAVCIITIGIFALHKYLITILLGVIVSLVYYIAIRSFIKDKPQVKEQLESFQGIINMSKKTLILMILAMLGSVFFIVLDFVIILRVDKKLTFESASFLLFSILLFMLFCSIIILKLRSSSKNKIPKDI